MVWKRSLPSTLPRSNKDLVAGKPTMDVGVYFPSNLDPAFAKVTLERMLQERRSGQSEIFGPGGDQPLVGKDGEVDPKFPRNQANGVPGVPTPGVRQHLPA